MLAVMSRSKGARLAVREARLITKELRLLGVSPAGIAKLWALIIAIPIVFICGYLLINYDSGTSDPAVLSRVQLTPLDQYHVHVKNNSPITLKSLTLTCSPGGDAQPVTSISRLYPPLKSGYGEDTYLDGNCTLVRVNESHQLW
jgi:hypothetical protein